MSGATKLMTAGGGGVNITAASSIASDVTVNVPSQNCTLGIQGPAFSAYATAGTTCSNSTSTKVSFQAEEFDTNSNFDTSTYRFTPTVSGYYQVNATVPWNQPQTQVFISIYKNGSEFKRGFMTGPVGSSAYITNVAAIVYMNGSTDYIEIYAQQNSGSSQATATGNNITYFQAALVRAA